MKAVILAAGVGSRLGELTADKPKCMLNINGKSLIHYQIETLKKHNINEIYIIGGYKFDVLKNHIKNTDVALIYNPKYREWNNIYSFYLIKDIPHLTEFILLNADTYFHENILKQMLKFEERNAVMLDAFKKLGDEEMKVIVKDKKVKKFGKDIPVYAAKGEYIGMAKFNRNDLEVLFKTIEKLLIKGKTDIWYEIAFNYVLDELDIGYTETEGFPWIEIDNNEDYRKALSLSI